MQIEKDERFARNLKAILRFIAFDSKQKARAFNSSLFRVIATIPSMPYRFRSSRYYQEETIRDLIFKGYTIPFLIDSDGEKIILLDIFKWSQR